MRRLYLADNEIREVGRGTFKSVSRIGTIDLARNKIKTIDFQMFHELQYVEVTYGKLIENDIYIYIAMQLIIVNMVFRSLMFLTMKLLKFKSIHLKISTLYILIYHTMQFQKLKLNHLLIVLI